MAEPLGLSSLFHKTQKGEDVKEEEGARRPPLLNTIFAPGVIIVASNLAAIALVEKFYWGTETLFLSTPIKDGGLGLTPRAIGTFESISSIVIGASQLFIFPRMHEEWGSKYVAVLGVFATLPRFVLWPFINWIAGRDGYTSLVWFSLGSQACCSALAQFGFRKSFYMQCLWIRRNHTFSRHLGFDHPVAWKPWVVEHSSRFLSGVLYLIS